VLEGVSAHSVRGVGLANLINPWTFGRVARFSRVVVVWWKLMSRPSTLCARAATVACAVLLAVGVPGATAAPATDEQGYVDSTARCTTPNAAVEFGSTAASRVAICKTPGGRYEYRGVRLRDGARLILPATRSDDGAYVAANDGIEYLVGAKSLVISAGTRVIREEPWVDFHGTGVSQAPATSTPATPTPTPTTPLPPPLPAEVGGG
jgi:hypothetical protein